MKHLNAAHRARVELQSKLPNINSSILFEAFMVFTVNCLYDFDAETTYSNVSNLFPNNINEEEIQTALIFMYQQMELI